MHLFSLDKVFCADASSLKTPLYIFHSMFSFISVRILWSASLKHVASYELTIPWRCGVADG